MACKNGHLNVVKLLDEELTNLQETFFAACQSGNVDLVLHLMKQYDPDKLPSEFNLKYINGHKALDIACAHGNAEVVKILLASGKIHPSAVKGLNRRNETIFRSACNGFKCNENNLEVVKLL